MIRGYFRHTIGRNWDFAFFPTVTLYSNKSLGERRYYLRFIWTMFVIGILIKKGK